MSRLKGRTTIHDSPTMTDFRRGVVEPVECLKEGWALIKDQYWLFLGISLVGMLLGGAVPIVLLGPMMSGIFLCLFKDAQTTGRIRHPVQGFD